MEDFEDETIMERILGLTEMFPESVQARASALVSGSVSGVRYVYRIWISSRVLYNHWYSCKELLTKMASNSNHRWLYSMSRSASWIIFSSSAILFMPAMIQTERMGLEEMQKRQQRQVLLGPGAAVSGNPQNM